MSKKLLTVSQLADFLGVKPVTIYSWVKRRKVPHVVLSVGKRKECVRFRPEAIEAWIEAREREAKTDLQKWDLR